MYSAYVHVSTLGKKENNKTNQNQTHNQNNEALKFFKKKEVEN